MSTEPKSINVLHSMNYRSNKHWETFVAFGCAVLWQNGASCQASINQKATPKIYIFLKQKKEETNNSEMKPEHIECLVPFKHYLAPLPFEHHRVPVAIGRGRLVVKVSTTIYLYSLDDSHPLRGFIAIDLAHKCRRGFKHDNFDIYLFYLFFAFSRRENNYRWLVTWLWILFRIKNKCVFNEHFIQRILAISYDGHLIKYIICTADQSILIQIEPNWIFR